MLTSETNKICILYVDDEEHNLHAFKANFRKDFTVYTACSVNEGQVILAIKNIHVLIMDHRMISKLSDENCIIRKHNKQQHILLTTFADVEYLENAVKKGKIHAYFQKPWNETKLKYAIEEAYQLYQKNEN